jgi:hypothetical protein
VEKKSLGSCGVKLDLSNFTFIRVVAATRWMTPDFFKEQQDVSSRYGNGNVDSTRVCPGDV